MADLFHRVCVPAAKRDDGPGMQLFTRSGPNRYRVIGSERAVPT